MNQRSLIAIIVLAGIGSIGSVLAYSGTISAGQGNFNNVLITGACTGCGGSGSFTSYTLQLNETVAGTNQRTSQSILVSTDGSILGSDSQNDAIVFLNGTVKAVYTNDGSTATPTSTDQSIDGVYKVIIDNSGNSIVVYKNNVLIQTITINPSAFSTGFNLSKESIGISSDGKYIAIYGPDISAENRLTVFKGS